MRNFLSLATMAAALSALSVVSGRDNDNNGRRELIIHGQDAPPGRYPYFTTLAHYCGGALIAPDVILTAGHCMPAHKRDVQPHVGRYTFYSKNDTSRAYDIIAMDRPYNWRAVGDDEMSHDFALLFLNETITDIPYLRINRDDNIPLAKQTLMAMGMGWTSPDWKTAQKADTLQDVELNYLPNEQCEQSSNVNSTDDDDEVTSYQGRIHSDHLCTTGGPNNERDACAYDSGSPIIIKGDSPEEDVLVALVSWGEGCADPDFPAVNARISFARDFIDQRVCKRSVDPPADFGCHNNNDHTSSNTPAEAPSSASTTTPQQQGHHFLVFPMLVIVGLAGYWLAQKYKQEQQLQNNRNNSPWRPSHKDYRNDQHTGETDYLFHTSPASSTGSKESRSSYDAIEIF